MQEYNPQLLMDFLRHEADDSGRSVTSRNARRQAVGSFLRLMRERLEGAGGVFSEGLLAEWLIRMEVEGYTRKTAAYYLKQLSALYARAVRESLAPACGAFASVQLRMKSLPESAVPSLEALRKMLTALSVTISDNSLTEDLTLYSILGGGLSARQIVDLAKEPEIPPMAAALDELHLKYARPRAKRLFPLAQADRSATAIAREVDLRISALLRRHNIYGNSDSLWAVCALSVDVAPSTILAVLGRRPASLSLFELVEPDVLTEQQKNEVIDLVADALTDNPYQWFVMQLRPGADFEQVMTLAALHPDNIYYPLCEVTRRVGRRKISSLRPFLPGTVFFRVRLSDVAPLFRLIGSLAWPYRLTPAPDSPYAVISPLEMRAFQLAIGVIPTEADAPADLHPGDTVEIIGGNFRGLIATIQSTAPNLYRLLLPALNGITWQIDTSPHLLRPHL